MRELGFLWVKWVKNGWIDITLPMAYYFGTSEIEIATKNLVTFNENKAFSYTGISPNYEGVPSIMNAYQIEACIQNQAQGYAIFSLPNILANLRKNDIINIKNFNIKTGETTPPKRYSSGSMILAMENAGKLIEDEALREQIKGSGIGTSATRAEIIKKLEKIDYIAINKKTQILTFYM